MRKAKESYLLFDFAPQGPNPAMNPPSSRHLRMRKYKTQDCWYTFHLTFSNNFLLAVYINRGMYIHRCMSCSYNIQINIKP